MTARRRRKRRLNKKAIAAALGTLCLAALLPLLSWLGYDLDDLAAMVWQPSVNAAYPAEGTAEVHFLDVGQASSILVKGSEGTVLIDGGERENAQSIIDYLASNGVSKIDYFFNTHPHSDHMGGCQEILEAIPTGEFIMTRLPEKSIPTTVTYQKLVGWLGDHKETVRSVTGRAGEVYDLGGGLRLEIIGPTELYDDLNNTSLVLRLDFGGTSFLFPGDMEAKAERALAESGALSPVMVLAAPHHGSDTSIDKGFMERLSPDISVISCGEGNDYGHPSPKTLELYEKLAIRSYRTDLQGSIKIITDGSKLTIETEKE